MGIVLRPSDRPRRHVHGFALAGMLLLTLSLLLVGCAYTTMTDSGLGSGGSSGSSTGPIKGTTVRPCVGPYAAIDVEGRPALTLSDGSSPKTGSVHVGDLVQIQLSGSWHWGLNSNPTHLTATQYAGAYDQTPRLCFWNFHAQSAGTATIQFTGTALCESGQPCPAIARLESFTVQVS